MSKTRLQFDQFKRAVHLRRLPAAFIFHIHYTPISKSISNQLIRTFAFLNHQPSLTSHFTALLQPPLTKTTGASPAARCWPSPAARPRASPAARAAHAPPARRSAQRSSPRWGRFHWGKRRNVSKSCKNHSLKGKRNGKHIVQNMELFQKMLDSFELSC